MAVGEVSSPGAAALAENLVGLSAGNGEQQQQLAGCDELQLSKKCASLLLSKKARKVEKRKEKLEEERRLREEAKRKKTYPFFSSYH